MAMKLITIKRTNEIMNGIPAALTEDMSISGDAKMLWVKLWNSNKGKKKNYKEFKPTIGGLAKIFNTSKSTIKRWKKELDDSGWITTIGVKYDTNIIVNLTPNMGSNMTPNMGSNLSHFTILNEYADKSPNSFNKKILYSNENVPASSDTFNEYTSVTGKSSGVIKS